MQLSQSRKELLRIVIQYNPVILSKVLNENEVSGPIEITDDGFLIFYRAGWPKWLQRLFNDTKSVSILDMSIRIADAVTGLGSSRNDAMFDGLTKTILDEAIKRKDLNRVVDVLFDHMRHGSDGELASTFVNKKDIKEFTKNNPEMVRKNFKVNIEDNTYAFVGIQLSSGAVMPVSLGKIVKQ